MKIKFYQDGGAVPPQEGAPAGPEAGAAPGGAPEGGQDPLMQIAQTFAQALQSQDCAALAQGAQMFLQLIEQAQGGGQGAPPEGGGEQPVYMKKGGKFILKKKVAKNAKPESVEMAKKGGKGKGC